MTFKVGSIFSSRLFGALGFQVFSLFAMLQAFALSPKLTTIGFLGFSTFISVLAFSFLSGVWVDRLRAKGLYAVILHGFLVAIGVSSLLLPPTSVWQLYVLSFLIGSLRVMRSPVYFALTKESLQTTNEPERTKRFFVMSWQLAAVIGPLLGGLLGLHSGLRAMQIGYVTLFLLAFLTLLPALRIRGVSASRTQTEEGLASIVGFFFRDRILRETFLLDTLGVLFAGVTAFLPFLLAQNHLSADHVGLLRALQNLGSFAIAAALPRAFLTGRVFLISVFSFALMTTCVPFLHSLLSFAVVFALLGLLDGVSILMRDLLLFEKASSHAQGRIYALNSIFISSSDDLGEMESGFVASFIGVPATAIVGGLACAGLSLYFAFTSKPLWTFAFKQETL